jgi:hypothetical protein
MDGRNALLDVVNGQCLLYFINLNLDSSSKMKLSKGVVQLPSSGSATMLQLSSLGQS